MPLFATPDFGAGATIAGCAMLVYLAAFGLALVASLRGLWLLTGGPSPRARKWGIALTAAGCLIPCFCCLAPLCVVGVTTGNFQTWGYVDGKVSVGMSREDVAARLGKPHEHYADDDGESWYYYADSLGVGYTCVRFGPDGRVTRTRVN